MTPLGTSKHLAAGTYLIDATPQGGKTVTVIFGLPHNDTFLSDLAQELKRACGVGGTVPSGARPAGPRA